jgi:uncharacterized repeat protein (TIGR01451 family)
MASAAAGGANANSKLALHVVSHGTSCKSLPAVADCSELVTTFAGTGEIDVIPVFYNLNETVVLEFGLAWPEEWGTCQYSTCWGNVSLGGIVNPGDGVVTTSFSCDSSWSIAHGFGWLGATSPGRISVVANPPTSEITVVDCQPEYPGSDWPAATFSSAIGGGMGDDPCAAPLNPPGIAISDGLGGGCAAEGGTVTYTLSYDNADNSQEIHGAYLVAGYWNEFAGMEFVSASSGGVYRPDENQVAWNIGSLGPGETGSVQVTLRVKPTAGTRVYNEGRIVCAGAPHSDAATSTPVCSSPLRPLDLAESDGLGGGCAASGSDVTYTLTYGNSGNAVDIHGVVLTDRLPDLVDFLSASSDGTYDPVSRRVTWSIGTLAHGEAGSQSVAVRVTAAGGHTLTNACEIAADEPVGRTRTINTLVCGSPPRNPSTKVAIHVKPHGTDCSMMPGFASCSEITTTSSACGEVDFIPVFCELNEIVALEFGVTWPAEWGTCVFAACDCDSWVGDLSQPGGGLAEVWLSCQRSWSVVTGYGWLSATGPGLISPCLHPEFGHLGVYNCAEGDSTWYDPAQTVIPAGVCGAVGMAPCGGTGIQPSTWGAIKAMFK